MNTIWNWMNLLANKIQGGVLIDATFVRHRDGKKTRIVRHIRQDLIAKILQDCSAEDLED